MDQAKLSRLRFLLVELVEQLKLDAFDPSDHKQTIFLLGEVNRLCNELGRLELSLIETDWKHGGRVTWQHPGMTFSAPLESDFRATKQKPVDKAMWSAMRCPEVLRVLDAWVRWIDNAQSIEVAALAATTPTAPAGETPIGELPPLDDTEVKILRRLASSVGVVLTQEDLMARNAANADRKTVGNRLNRLMGDDVGYVKRPKGRKRGYIITSRGVERLRLLDAAETSR